MFHFVPVEASFIAARHRVDNVIIKHAAGAFTLRAEMKESFDQSGVLRRARRLMTL